MRNRRSNGVAAALLAGLVLAAGCAMSQHRNQIRQGFLTKGLHRDAFVKEWGAPTRTFPLPAKEPVLRVNAFGGYWEKPIYEVWEYRRRATCLVFDGVRLISWETGRPDCDPRSERAPRSAPPDTEVP